MKNDHSFRADREIQFQKDHSAALGIEENDPMAIAIENERGEYMTEQRRTMAAFRRASTVGKMARIGFEVLQKCEKTENAQEGTKDAGSQFLDKVFREMGAALSLGPSLEAKNDCGGFGFGLDPKNSNRVKGEH
jgi:hypothetical protein